jgi:hypothetical protein
MGRIGMQRAITGTRIDVPTSVQVQVEQLRKSRVEMVNLRLLHLGRLWLC